MAARSISTTRYAQDTQVSSDRTRGQIERELALHGATAFGYGYNMTQSSNRAVIMFEIGDRRIRMELPIPTVQELADERVRYGRAARAQPRGVEVARQLHPKRERERWRALLLIVKAKLEAVRCGIRTLEQEFLADVVLADGQTVGEFLGPQLALTYQRGEMPPLLPGPRA